MRNWRHLAPLLLIQSKKSVKEVVHMAEPGGRRQQAGGTREETGGRRPKPKSLEPSKNCRQRQGERDGPKMVPDFEMS